MTVTRPLLAVVVSGSILSGMAWFMQSKVTPLAPRPRTDTLSEVQIEFTVSCTGDLAPNEFAVSSDGAPSLEVRINGESVFRVFETVPHDQVIQVTALPPWRAGWNDLVVTASLSQDAMGRDHALRMVMFSHGRRSGDPQYGWCPAGEDLFQLTLQVNVPTQGAVAWRTTRQIDTAPPPDPTPAGAARPPRTPAEPAHSVQVAQAGQTSRARFAVEASSP